MNLEAMLRSALTGGIRKALGGDPETFDEYRGPAGDPGLFGPGSVVWQVHGDLPAMLVGGISSLMLQTLHPLAMAGVAEHSKYREDPFGRLQRTARFVGGTTFGSTALVDQLVDEVRHVHRYIRGIAPDGRPYEAGDPDLLTWVHTAEAWSFLRAYQRYGPRPLLRSEKDEYLAEMSQVAVRLGARDVPTSVSSVRRYLRAVEPELRVTPEALDAVHFLSTPLTSSPPEMVAHRIVAAAAMDLLPPNARQMLGLRRQWPLEGAQVRGATVTFALVLRWAVGPSEVRAIAEERSIAS